MPQEREERSAVVSVRLTREEYRTISQEAARNRMTISEFMRTAALEDNASSLDQLRIEVRQQEEVLEHVIFMLEMIQQTNMELFVESMRKLMRIDGGMKAGETQQEYMKRLEAEARAVLSRTMDRAVDKEVSLHITGDWDTKDPLRLRQYESRIKRYLDRDDGADEDA